jgi:hypothetical protein
MKENFSPVKRLFIIANTTHYLNVNKYIESHENGENFIVLTIRRFEGYQDFIQRVKTNANLKVLKIIFVDQKKKKPFHYIDIFKIIGDTKWMRLRHKTFDEVLFTNYNSWVQHYILKQYNPKKIILISDGTGVFSIAELRKNDLRIPFDGSKVFVEKVLGLSSIKNLHIYSQVDIEVASHDTIEVFKFNSSKNNIVDSKKVFFVGSPLVELGYLEIETHITNLKKIKDQFQDCTFYYFSHRREQEKNLEKYRFFGEIMRDNIPFEERMEKEKRSPGKVISYMSSILINLPQVFSKIQFYYLQLNKEEIASDPEFDSRYENLEREFKKIHLPNFKVLN